MTVNIFQLALQRLVTPPFFFKIFFKVSLNTCYLTTNTWCYSTFSPLFSFLSRFLMQRKCLFSTCDLVVPIFQCLDHKSLGISCQVCMLWYTLITEDKKLENELNKVCLFMHDMNAHSPPIISSTCWNIVGILFYRNLPLEPTNVSKVCKC